MHLPVTPALKKFLTARFGTDYRLSIDDWFGAIVLNVLQNKTNKHYEVLGRNKDVNKYKTEKFSITLSMSTAEKSGFLFLPRHQASLHNIVDSIFREDMYIQALTNKTNYMIEYQTTIRNVLASYDITDEEMSYDSIKRDFARKKKSLEDRLFL